MGSMIAGPFGATLLADFGADVVKLEPQAGDPIRGVAPIIDGVSLYWAVDGRGKRSVVLDARDPANRDDFLALVAACDVLIENFRAGTLESWGLGPDILLEANPDLVLVRVSGFGQTGSRAGQASYDRVVQAMGGLAHVTGFPESPPVVSGFAMSDYTTGVFAALSALIGLIGRHRHGKPVVFDVAALECLVRLGETSISEFDRLGTIRTREGNIHPSAAPINMYRCGDGEWVFLQAPTNRLFGALAEVIGRPDLAERPELGSIEGRVRHRGEVDEIIGAWMATQAGDEAVATLTRAGVAAGAVGDAHDLATDPDLLARGAVVRAPRPEGDLLMQGVVPRITGSHLIPGVAPDLGSSSVGEVLAGWSSG